MWWLLQVLYSDTKRLALRREQYLSNDMFSLELHRICLQTFFFSPLKTRHCLALSGKWLRSLPFEKQQLHKPQHCSFVNALLQPTFSTPSTIAAYHRSITIISTIIFRHRWEKGGARREESRIRLALSSQLIEKWEFHSKLNKLA